MISCTVEVRSPLHALGQMPSPMKRGMARVRHGFCVSKTKRSVHNARPDAVAKRYSQKQAKDFQLVESEPRIVALPVVAERRLHRASARASCSVPNSDIRPCVSGSAGRIHARRGAPAARDHFEDSAGSFSCDFACARRHRPAAGVQGWRAEPARSRSPRALHSRSAATAA